MLGITQRFRTMRDGPVRFFPENRKKSKMQCFGSRMVLSQRKPEPKKVLRIKSRICSPTMKQCRKLSRMELPELPSRWSIRQNRWLILQKRNWISCSRKQKSPRKRQGRKRSRDWQAKSPLSMRPPKKSQILPMRNLEVPIQR